MKIAFTSLLLCAALTVFAQINYSFTWMRSFGGPNDDYSGMMCFDANNNVYMGGSFSDSITTDGVSSTFEHSGNGDDDAFFVKLNSSGGYEWSIGFGGSGTDKCSGSCYANGFVYITGQFQGVVDFDPGSGVTQLTSAGNYDIFLLKMDTNGVFQWVIGLGGAGIDQGGYVRADLNGNIWLEGTYQSGMLDIDPGSGVQQVTSNGSADVFIVKLDPQGNYIWGGSIGGSGLDIGRIDVSPNGDIYLSGSVTGNNVDLDPGAGSTNFTTLNLSEDLYIIKLDVSGNYQWSQRIGGTGLDRGFVRGFDAQGRLFASGIFSGTVDFDPGSGTANLTTNGFVDAYLLRLDSNGNFDSVWDVVGGAGDPTSCYAVQDSAGNFYLAGTFDGNCDFDPGPVVYSQSSVDNNIYYLSLDTAGTFLWAAEMGSSIYNDNMGGIYMDAQQSLYTSATFKYAYDADITSGTANVAGFLGSANALVTKMTHPSFASGIFSVSSHVSLVYYPVPTSDALTIRFDRVQPVAEVELWSADGKLIRSMKGTNSSTMTVDMQNVPAGLYCVRVKTETEVNSFSIVHSGL